MKKYFLVLLLFVGLSSVAYAQLIGPFPGLAMLIAEAEAIVVLRVEKMPEGGAMLPDGWRDCECRVLQTLKGELRQGEVLPLLLYDVRTKFENDFAQGSTHLTFLVKNDTPGETARYRSLTREGGNVRLTPFGHEKKPEGKTVREQIVSLLRATEAYNKKHYEKEQAYLQMMIKGEAADFLK